MSWEGSDRKSRLPSDWPRRRAEVKARAGGRCEVLMKSGKRCHDKGTDCDHVIPGDDHELSNLQWICDWHHKQKSSREGHDAYAAQRAKRLRPETPHPGLKKGGDENAGTNQEGSGTPPHTRPHQW